MIAQAINAAARQHQQAVLHDMNFHHGQGRAGLVGHGVDGEIEGRIVGDQRADFQRRVAQQRLRRDLAFAAGENPWGRDSGKWLDTVFR